MTFLNPLDALIPKIPFSFFFLDFWVWATSEARGSVSVGFWGSCQLSPFGGGFWLEPLAPPPHTQTKTRPPQHVPTEFWWCGGRVLLSCLGYGAVSSPLSLPDASAMSAPHPHFCPWGQAGQSLPLPVPQVAFIIDEIEFYQTVEHATAAFCHHADKKIRQRLQMPTDKTRELTEEQEAALEAERMTAAEQVAPHAADGGRHRGPERPPGPWPRPPTPAPALGAPDLPPPDPRCVWGGGGHEA